MTKAAGRLGHGLVSAEADQLHLQSGGRTNSGNNAGTGANGGLLLRRIAWTDVGDRQREREQATGALRDAAARAMLPKELLMHAAKRRAAAVRALRRRGRPVVELLVRPEWRLVVGLDKDTPSETGMALHGTYGAPVLPGTALKGTARAYARGTESCAEDYREFGAETFGRGPSVTSPSSHFSRSNRSSDSFDSSGIDTGTGTETDFGVGTGSGAALGAGAGTSAGAGRVKALAGGAVILDALPEPAAGGRGVVPDVLNPHVPAYYRSDGAQPPAEYLQPIPVMFLTVTDVVAFRVHVIGRAPSPDTDFETWYAADWLAAALEDLGIGAKTNAGYGYCTVTRVASTIHGDDG